MAFGPGIGKEGTNQRELNSLSRDFPLSQVECKCLSFKITVGPVAYVTSVSARVRRESWDESKTKKE